MKSILTFLRQAYERFLTVLALLNLPHPTGYLLRLSADEIYRPGKNHGRYPRRILILGKAGFIEDIVDVVSKLPDVELVSLRRSSIKAIARAFLPPEVDDNNYISASDAAKSKMLSYRRFLKAMWRAFDPGGRFRVVATGNFGYFAEREVAAALESMGVPFIALHKENLKTPGRVAFWEMIYRERRGPFLGRRILVYNEIERSLMIGTKIAGPEKIDVVGMPRLDRVHGWRRANAGSTAHSTILFFSFLPVTGMPLIYRKGKNRKSLYIENTDDATSHLKILNLCSSVHKTILQLARECPELSVVVKTKGRPRDLEIIFELMGIGSQSEIPGNLSVVHGEDPFDLICNAAVVCGFNSTALLEALAAGKPVVVPSYAEAENREFIPFILDLGNAALKARTEEDLHNNLKRFAQKPEPLNFELNDEAKKVLNYWLGNDDGKASERAASIFDNLLEK